MISGIVENGKKLGRTIGFPTANILADGDAHLPENGVYSAAIWLEDGDAPWPCMVNVGVHPTVPEGKPTIEAHILNFEGDIYGCRVKIEIAHFLRPERRFDGLDSLRAQLDADRVATLGWAMETIGRYRWKGLCSDR